jgi:hypothetical protein
MFSILYIECTQLYYDNLLINFIKTDSIASKIEKTHLIEKSIRFNSLQLVTNKMSV